jgi:cytochrome c oxidase assembly factor CtaG
MNVAYAHGVSSTDPHGVFTLKWPWDPTLLFFLALAFFYVYGLRSYPGKVPVSRWQRVLFFVGIVVLCLAYLPPIDTVSDQLFCVHMIQHLLITAVGVPLIIFGAPFFVILRGLPARVRNKAVVPLLQNRRLNWLLRQARRPLMAVALYEGTFWFWHVPKFYNMALSNDAIHLVEHACMAFAAINLWQIFIDPFPLRSSIKMPLRILLLGSITTLDMVLSAALTYSDRVWYEYELLPLPSWWSWDRLQDQRLGGLVMWVPGGMVWIFATIAIFFVWALREQDTVSAPEAAFVLE